MDLSGFTTANLTDTSAGGNTFTVTDWTGSGSLSGTASETVVNVAAGSFTLSDLALSVGTLSMSLSGFTTANLTDISSGGNTFTVTNWSGSGSLTASSDALTATVYGDVTLSNTELTAGSASLALSGIDQANLTVSSLYGAPSYILDASAFSAGPANLTAAGRAHTIIYGGTAGYDVLTVAKGASGNDILIGNGAFDTLTDNSKGRNILIGAGAGGDAITGNGYDMLISGTTSYDSDTSANIAALDAILTEWTSIDTYKTRIAKIMKGVGPDLYAFNSSTIAPDTNANTLSDGSNQSTNTNWFLASSQDTVNESGETVTII